MFVVLVLPLVKRPMLSRICRRWASTAATASASTVLQRLRSLSATQLNAVICCTAASSGGAPAATFTAEAAPAAATGSTVLASVRDPRGPPPPRLPFLVAALRACSDASPHATRDLIDVLARQRLGCLSVANRAVLVLALAHVGRGPRGIAPVFLRGILQVRDPFGCCCERSPLASCPKPLLPLRSNPSPCARTLAFHPPTWARRCCWALGLVTSRC